MYTLEDDKETTSSLRKRDVAASLPSDDMSSLPMKEPTKGLPVDGTGEAQHMSLSTQVTSSLKKSSVSSSAATLSSSGVWNPDDRPTLRAKANSRSVLSSVFFSRPGSSERR